VKQTVIRAERRVLRTPPTERQRTTLVQIGGSRTLTDSRKLTDCDWAVSAIVRQWWRFRKIGDC